MMGRRNGGRSLQETLRRRLDSCKLKYSTVDELVNHLRSTYPDYQRTKHQTLTRFVQEALKSRKKPGDTPTPRHDEDDDNEDRSASRKRRKKIDEDEDRLQKMEALHIRRRMGSNKIHGPSSTSSASASGSEEDEAVSVSTSEEDAVYGQKVEPAFDLMKTMLRNSYTGTKVVMEEKNVELEVPNSSKVATLVNGGGGEAKSARKQSRGSVSDAHSGRRGGDVEVKGKDGPKFRDLGGMKEVLEELKMEVIVPLFHPQLPRELGVRPMTGILLHGPPGCGKTRLAHAIANETGLPFYQISATEVISGVSGASEENIRELFSKAHKTAPSIVFIDEIDAIGSKRENLQREMEKRIVTQLMTCMDQSNRLLQPADGSESSHDCPGYVLVIAATNRPDALDPALRRPGRFDREIMVGFPDESAREEILSVLTGNLKLDGSFDLREIAKSTPGFVGADLAALANKAGNLAMKRIIDERKHKLSQDLTSEHEHTEDWWRDPWLSEDIDKLSIKMSDFEEAVKMVQPSSKREGFSSIPNVKWEDVGGLDLLRQEFELEIIGRIKHPMHYERLGIDHETGFLLYGPPGCGKTLIAKAVANEAGANFIHIKGPELLNKYVGESELAVRTLFSRARTCAPCIVFFDEVDALTTKGKEGGWVTERLLKQLLTELDGVEPRQGVFVIGATNKPEAIDDAILRPGRFDRRLYVPLPSPEERVLILKALARKKPVDAGVDLGAIGRMEACDNLSGADLAALMHQAGMAALKEILISSKTTSDDVYTIKTSHFEVALSKVSPSVSDMQKKYYQLLSVSKEWR